MKKNKKNKTKKNKKQKLIGKLSHKIFENYMAAEIPSVVLLLKLT